MQFGDQFMGKVVNAVMSSPNWRSTMLIWTYDEHGGYYDHVPPPPAIPPDDIPPALKAGDPPGGFDRYGFRVPSGVISPGCQEELRLAHGLRPHIDPQNCRGEVESARPHARDANANSLFDMLDLQKKPAFLKPPKLPAAANPDAQSGMLEHWCRGHSSSSGGHQDLNHRPLVGPRSIPWTRRMRDAPGGGEAGSPTRPGHPRVGSAPRPRRHARLQPP